MKMARKITRRAALSQAASQAATAASVAVAAGTPAVIFARGSQSGDLDASDSQGPSELQSEEGIVVHACEPTQIMRGSPPSEEHQITLMNYQDPAPRARYGNMHLHEIYPTHLVSRGRGPITVLPRNNRIDPTDIERISFKDIAGHPTTIREHLETYLTNGFLVIKRGEIIYEGYWAGMEPSTRHALYSARKSLVASLVGSMLLTGEIQADGTVDSYVPELANSGYNGVTVRQALDMASGVKWSWRIDDADSECMRWLHAVRGTPVPALVSHQPEVILGQWKLLPTLVRQFSPGTTIAYRECDVQSLVWTTTKVGNLRFADLFSERVWAKLGAEHDALVPVDSFGFPTYTMAASLRDFGRWGQMLLQNGHFNGQDILPASFVNDVRANSNVDIYAASLPQSKGFDGGSPWVIDAPPGSGYRSFFWVPGNHEGAFLAWGHLGQFCYISPKYDTVLVKFGTFGGGTDDSFKRDWHALYQITKALP